jgi:hypothetical protein
MSVFDKQLNDKSKKLFYILRRKGSFNIAIRPISPNEVNETEKKFKFIYMQGDLPVFEEK